MNYPYANKELGQHFLIDQLVIDRITSINDREVDAIIEIGPGPGVLSKNLANLKIPYRVIETDTRFEEFLIPFIDKENILFADALSIDLNETIEQWGWKNKRIWLVSNLPYNISAPITVKLLQVTSIKYMSLMYQREVALKIVGNSKKIEMGSLMALCQNYFNVQSLCEVAREAFDPPPKVESQVLNFERIEDCEINLNDFLNYESFLRKIFSFKRKQFGTVLKNFYSKDKIQEVLNDIQLDAKIRAEKLDINQVYTLYRKFK